MRRASRAGLLLTAWLGGCASTDYDHLALTNLADRTLVPAPGLARHAVTPALVPLGALTLALDNIIIAPLASLPSAVLDADAFWDAEAGGYYTELALLPGRIALMPVVVAGSWLVRSFFGIEPREGAAWGWPAWGAAWVRDEAGHLLGPSTEFDPITKQRRPAAVRVEPDAAAERAPVEPAPVEPAPADGGEPAPPPDGPVDQPVESILDSYDAEPMPQRTGLDPLAPPLPAPPRAPDEGGRR